ncbi:hypothetical protein Pcinc_009226 [Petrolisthes cinctipes]|uniref:Gag-pol polyprotein n=1 Tax=Petrolisthes cinctipes TaxID=88211 RepID=A0AAE1G7Q7_PETCI|nr:hypothetical protein Pcinc_009226 [Petrolisthes cinctipes]
MEGEPRRKRPWRPNFTNAELLAMVTSVAEKKYVIFANFTFDLASTAVRMKAAAWQYVTDAVKAVSRVQRASLTSSSEYVSKGSRISTSPRSLPHQPTLDLLHGRTSACLLRRSTASYPALEISCKLPDSSASSTSHRRSLCNPPTSQRPLLLGPTAAAATTTMPPSTTTTSGTPRLVLQSPAVREPGAELPPPVWVDPTRCAYQPHTHLQEPGKRVEQRQTSATNSSAMSTNPPSQAHATHHTMPPNTPPPSHRIPPTDTPSRALLWVEDLVSGDRYLVDSGSESSTVFSTLLLSGKLQQREVVKVAPPALVSETTPLLHVIDRSSGSKFLVDTGASLLMWTFVLAEVTQPILGYDFLKFHKLSVDPVRHCLLHQPSNRIIRSLNVETDSPRVMGVTIDPTYDTILQEFQSLTKPATDATTPVDSPVYHYIETTGPPVFSRPRRLDPEKLQAAKQEFNREFCGDLVKDSIVGENEFLDTLRSTVSKFLASPPRTPDNQRCFVPSALGSAEYVWVRHDEHRRPLQRPYNGPFKVISKSSKYFTIQGPHREETVTIDRLKPAIVPSTTIDGGPVGSSQTPGEIYISVPSPPPSPAPELPHTSTSTDLKTDPLKIEPLVASPLKAESDISFSDSAGAKQCPQEVTTSRGRVSRPPDRYTSMVSLGPALTTRRGGGYCGASKPPQ